MKRMKAKQEGCCECGRKAQSKCAGNGTGVVDGSFVVGNSQNLWKSGVLIETAKLGNLLYCNTGSGRAATVWRRHSAAMVEDIVISSAELWNLET